MDNPFSINKARKVVKGGVLKSGDPIDKKGRKLLEFVSGRLKTKKLTK